MTLVLFILAFILLALCISFRKSAKKTEERFIQRPSVIMSPDRDLLLNEKYAIINILAFVMGTNERSAYDAEANSIMDCWVHKLGLSRRDVEKSIRVSMSHSSKQSVQTIYNSLSEIKDKYFIQDVYNDVKNIAEISDNSDIINIVDNMFGELLQ